MSVSFDFSGKKAIVAGASRGIGRDIVRALSEANCSTIYAIARTKADLEKLKKDFPCVEIVRTDLSDWDATRKAVEEIEPVHYLVNNAAVPAFDGIVNVKPEEFSASMEVNVKAVLNVSQIVCAKMLENGSVVNMSSQVVDVFTRDLLSYSVSKYALEGAIKHMAMELAPKIRVNCIKPTVVWTEMSALMWTGKRGEDKKEELPMKRFATLEEVSQATLFLLSGGAGMTTGHSFPVDGGVP